jgi:hypothetical protein
LNEKLTLSLAYLSGISFNEINTENILTVVSSLSIPQILILTITGSLLLSNIKFKNWRDKIPIYLYKCEKHGIQICYPQGHMHNLRCPQCGCLDLIS